MTSLILLALLGQTPVPSVTIPARTEASVVFVDRGVTYIIGIQSQKVGKIDGGIAPLPEPDGPSKGLTGQPRTFYESLVKSVPDAAKRSNGAKAMLSAISSTTAQAGALDLTAQQIIDELVASATTRKVNELLAGWNLAKLIADANVNTKEGVLLVLDDLKKALEACL
jgi:hypothetical protein